MSRINEGPSNEELDEIESSSLSSFNKRYRGTQKHCESRGCNKPLFNWDGEPLPPGAKERFCDVDEFLNGQEAQREKRAEAEGFELQ